MLTIRYLTEFSRLGAGVSGGILLSYLSDLSDLSDLSEKSRSGWVEVSDNQIGGDTGLSARQIDSARRLFKRKRILVERRTGVPSVKQYRIMHEALRFELLMARNRNA